jgi:hypothetical protein
MNPARFCLAAWNSAALLADVGLRPAIMQEVSVFLRPDGTSDANSHVVQPFYQQIPASSRRAGR